MRELPARQVHLDFHTSPLIPGVGSKFNKKQFQENLKRGHVGSITIFAKCHHGVSYYPTKIGTIHPALQKDFDLTGAMMDACHEIGVYAPVYITEGWSALDAEKHPDWIRKDKNGNPVVMNVDFQAKEEEERPEVSWVFLCLNGPYGDYVADIEQEVVDRYDHLDGLFFDICAFGNVCYCEHCKAGMKKMGLNPEKEADAVKYYEIKRFERLKKREEILFKKFPEATLFNNGTADIYKPQYIPFNTQLEMEDLPTAWGGYDKLPARASLMEKTGKEILGMTGKFNLAWGEFGGYKNPEALKFEVLEMAMNGAKASVGDQMLASGELDEETYKEIGVAYEALEKAEPWCYPSKSTAEIGIYLSQRAEADQGLQKILLEKHLDFNTMLEGDSLDGLKLVILPEGIHLSKEEAKRLQNFANQGGNVIFGYDAALDNGEFLLDAGVSFKNMPIHQRDFLKTGEKLPLPFGNAPYVCYQGAVLVELKDAEVLADLYEPYFDRTYKTYCGHQHAPYRPEKSESPAAVKKGNIIYYAHPLCAMYEKDGAQVFKETMAAMIALLYTPKYRLNIPSAGRTRLRKQENLNRDILHIGYASPIQRGRTDVIEDIVPLYQIPVEIDVTKEVKGVQLVPEMEKIPYEVKNGILSFTVPRVYNHQMIEIQYK